MIAWTAAGVVVAVGVIVVIAGLLTHVPFGWFAYQPLANATFAPAGSGVFVSRLTIVGSVVLGLGLFGLAFLAGWHWRGSRRS